MLIQVIAADKSNFGKERSRKKIRYIVLHYTGNDGDTAEENGEYFKKPNRKASAHYFCDERSIVQTVQDNFTAWHCGAKKYKHKQCRNENSIGIEMCSRKKNGRFYIEEKTAGNALWLVRVLMKKYNIPISHVLRHYDVTGKDCPKPWVREEKVWKEFKERAEEMRYNKIEEMPEWARETIRKLIEEKKIANKEKLDLSEDMLRVLVIMNR